MEGMANITKNVTKGLGIFVLLLSLVSATLVKKNAWLEPCGGPAVAPPPGLPVTPPIQIVNAMTPILDEAVNKASELRNKYKNERFSNTDEYIELMENVHFDGMPKVSTPLSEISQSLSNLVLLYQTMYEKVSRGLVFLEVVALDESLFESSSYIADVTSIQRGSLDFLCNSQKLILNAGETINYVSSSILNDNVKDYSNEFQRHVRDYIIVKDVHELLKDMQLHVAAISNSLAA